MCDGATLRTVLLTDTRVDPGGVYKTLPEIALRQFLMPDRFFYDGFLFAFVAYFVSETPVRLQVWRPAGASPSTNSFELVCQRRIIVTRHQLSRRVVVGTECLTLLRYVALCES